MKIIFLIGFYLLFATNSWAGKVKPTLISRYGSCASALTSVSNDDLDIADATSNLEQFLRNHLSSQDSIAVRGDFYANSDEAAKIPAALSRLRSVEESVRAGNGRIFANVYRVSDLSGVVRSRRSIKSRADEAAKEAMRSNFALMSLSLLNTVVAAKVGVVALVTNYLAARYGVPADVSPQLYWGGLAAIDLGLLGYLTTARGLPETIKRSLSFWFSDQAEDEMKLNEPNLKPGSWRFHALDLPLPLSMAQEIMKNKKFSKEDAQKFADNYVAPFRTIEMTGTGLMIEDKPATDNVWLHFDELLEIQRDGQKVLTTFLRIDDMPN